MLRCLPVVLLTIQTAVFAAPLLDQRYDDAGNFLTILAESDAYVGQIVTAGRAGKLVAVEIAARDREEFALPWQIDIIEIDAGVPTGRVLASEVSALPSPPSFEIPRRFLRIDFASPATFMAGEAFGISIHPQGVSGSPGLFAGAWPGGRGDPYPNGAAFFGGTLHSLRVSAAGEDLNFRTHVESVPEPASISLVVIGAWQLIRQRKRRRADISPSGRVY